jgi:hypothetical protein
MNVPTEELVVFLPCKEEYSEIKSTILFEMEPDLQNHFEDFVGPHEIIEELKTMFQTQARSERYAISKKFLTCKMEEGSSIIDHTIRMMGYTQRLEQLECKLPEDLKIERVLQSLHS